MFLKILNLSRKRLVALRSSLDWERPRRESDGAIYNEKADGLRGAV